MHNRFLPLTAILIAILLFALVSIPDTSVAQSSKRVEAKGFKPISDTEKMKRWGIIIGINAYDDPNINSLRYASADASAIYEVLTHPQTGGFKKERLHLLTSDSENPPTRNNILESLTLLSRMIRAGDTVVFHFSGHGLTQDGINYLLPADTRVNIPTETAIPLSRVYAAIQNAKRQIIFLDACHSGQRRDKGATSGSMSSAFAEAVFSEAEGRVTLASCNINESSFEDDQLGHGVFTYYLLEALRGKADILADKRVTASEANRYVVEKVKAWAFANRKQQNPRISSNVSGEIVLTTATLSVPRVPTPPPVDPGSTPIVGTFEQTVAEIKALETELEQKLKQNRQRIAENLRQGEEEITEFRKSHKLNAPKDMFESDADYAERIKQLDALVAKRQEELQKRYFEDVQRLLGSTQTQIQIAGLYRRIFPTNDVTVTLGTYDANNEFFPITFEVSLNGENHRYKSQLSLNKVDARNLYHNWDKVIKNSYLSIDPGYRRGLAQVKLEYLPLWEQGVTWTLDVGYDLGNNNSVDFSPDGKYLATGGRNGNAIIWKLSSGEEIWRTALGNQVNAVAFSPDGQYLSTGDTRNVTLWEVSSGTPVWRMALGKQVNAVAFSPDGKYLATGDSRNAILWEVSDGRKVWQKQYTYPSWSESGGGFIGNYRMAVRHTPITASAHFHAVAFNQNGKYLVTESDGDQAVLWQVNSGQKIREMQHNINYPRSKSVNTVSFSADGKYLATGDVNKKINLWAVNSGHRLRQVEHEGSVNAVAFSPNGQYLAAGGSDKAITFYRIPANITIEAKITKEKVIGASGEVTDLAWSPYGNLISDGKKVYRTLLQPEIVRDVR